MISISLVVPVYSGEQFLKKLADQVSEFRKSLESEKSPFVVSELIFVEDSAIDDSGKIIDLLSSEHDWVEAIHLSRNYGQHAATIAGVLHTSGDWVATLDEDLQHPPEKIVDMLRSAVESGYDIVYARPKEAVHESSFRDWASRSYKRLINILTGNPNIQNVNSFRLIRGSVAGSASSVCTHDTYFDIALCWFTDKIGTTNMTLKDERYIKTGKSGYNLKSLLSHARRLFISSQLKILRLSAFFGFATATLSCMASIFLFLYKLVEPSAINVQGWTSTILVMSFLGGANAIAVGGGIRVSVRIGSTCPWQASLFHNRQKHRQCSKRVLRQE